MPLPSAVAAVVVEAAASAAPAAGTALAASVSAAADVAAPTDVAAASDVAAATLLLPGWDFRCSQASRLSRRKLALWVRFTPLMRRCCRCCSSGL